MRIPKKKELLELQRKYRTDKKIGEVYGVPARLVAYWRNKKKITSYSFPKYTEDKIRELWERFGDDGRAGEELNISRAGFRQWRRKYHIDHKPLQLRLEQLELPLPDAIRRKGSRRETIVQKILSKKSGLKKVEIGEMVNIEPDIVTSHINSAQVIQHFHLRGAERLWDPAKIVIVLDRPGPSGGNGTPPQRAVRDFVKKQKIKNFYDIGQGICHQLVMENAHVLPGQLALASDPQSSSYGSIGALAMAANPEEMAATWATGRVRIKIPETIKVVVDGRMARGVYARDISLKLVRDLSRDGAAQKILEFYGSAISTMSLSERFTLTCLSESTTRVSALIPFDDSTARFLRKMVKIKFAPVAADPDAAYISELDIDINYLSPQVAFAGGGEGVFPVEEVAGKRVDQVVLGCCANGRIDDLEIAARILRGRHISRDVRMIIVPSSRKVLSEALERGFVRSFVDSGCMVMVPGCGPCIDAHQVYLEPGERSLTTSGCAFAGNHGPAGPEILVSSPATAAASALEGAIADPRKYIK